MKFSSVLSFVAAVLLALFVSSCGNSSSSPNNTGTGSTDYGGNTFAKMGSTYVYDAYQTDSMSMKVPGSDTTITATVVSTGGTYLGKSKVFQVDDGGAVNFYTYEHNGDLDLALDTAGSALSGATGGMGAGLVPTQWFTFFTGSKIKGDLQVLDTSVTMTIPNVPLPLTIEIKAVTGYVGEESVTVGSEVLACSKVHVKMTILALGSTMGYVDMIYWFSPKIGYFAKEQVLQSAITVPILGFSIPASGSVQVLTSYHLN